MTIDIIIPNFNGSHLIKENLPEVIKSHKEYNGKIIVVDDGSAEDDKKNLMEIAKKDKSGKVILIEHSKNLGFSSAVNTGVSTSKADFVVLLNSDVVPKADFLKPLIKKIGRNKNCFGIGCMDESVEGEKVVRRGRGIGYWEKGMLLHKKGDINKSDTFWISGGSSIIRRSLIEELGGFDTLFNPFYWEDIDLSYRAVKSGYEIFFENKSVVRHYHEEGAIKKGFTEGKINKIAYRNQLIFIWKNITSFHLLINHILFIPVNILVSLARLDPNFMIGFLLALGKLPAIMRKRNLQKKYYKVSDISILSHIS